MQTVRGFYWLSKAFPNHYQSNEHEFMIGLYDYDPETGEDGGTDGEFAIRWVKIDYNKYTPKLEIYNDAWSILPVFQTLFEALANISSEEITPEGLRLILLSFGLVDLTKSG